MLANHPDFHFTIGKKVFEIRPSIEWNKGDALNYLLEAFGFHNASKVFPIYIGDDKTDEDAFKVHIYSLNGSIKPLNIVIILFL